MIGKTFEKDEHGAYYVENLACGHNGRVLALDESMGVYRWCRECPIVQPASAPKRATS